MNLYVYKTVAKECGSAYPSGRWFINPVNRWCTEPWSICWQSSWPNKHVFNVSIVQFQLRQLCVVHRSLPPGVMRSLMHVFVLCRLDYCNSLMAGLPLCDVKRLQMVQKAAARLFCDVSRRSHVLPVLRDELHWLPIKKRIDFQVIVISVKAMNGLAPSF